MLQFSGSIIPEPLKYKLFPWLIGSLLLVVIFLASFSAPTLLQSDPSERFIKATYNAPFTLRFSHIMQRRSVEENFMILPKTEGTFHWADFRTLEFMPENPLTIGDEYRIIIKGEAKSIWMKEIGYDLSLDYRITGPPYVLFTDPPSGEVINKEEAITVMFDRAMDFESHSTKELIQMTPDVSGRLEPLGLSAFRFYPKILQPAQTYEVSVPAGITAIDGGETAESHSWVVTTPDLAVETTSPISEAKDVSLDQAIVVTFDASVDLDKIRPGANALLYPSNDLDADVTPKNDGFFNTEVTYELDKNGEPLRNVLVFKPTFDYQPDEQYRFVLKSDKSLHLAEDHELFFSTESHLAEGEQDEKEESVLTDVSDEPDDDAAATTSTAPQVRETFPMQYFIRGEYPRLRLKKVLSETAVLSVCPVSSNEFIRVTASGRWKSFRCRETEPETIDPAQAESVDVINLNDSFRLDWNAGLYFASVSQGGHKDIYHFMIEDTTLLMKRSDSSLLVWVLDMKSGEPIPDMDIEILAYDGELVSRGETDEHGVFETTRPLDEGIYVRAKLEDETGLSRFALVSDRWNWGEDLSIPSSEDSHLQLFLNQQRFLPGDSIKLKGIWRTLKDDVLSLPDASQVTVILEDRQGDFRGVKRIPMRRNGSFDGTFLIPSDLEPGDYLISVGDLNELRLSPPTPIRIIKETADLHLEWLKADQSYAHGLAPIIIAKARYQSGIAAGGFKGTYTLLQKPFQRHHQEGSISYDFQNSNQQCGTECETWKIIKTGDVEFDTDGEAKLFLTDGNDDFLESGNLYEMRMTAELPGDERTGIKHRFSVHQGEYDLGLGLKHALIGIDELIEASIVTLDREDASLLAGNKVKVALIFEGEERQVISEDVVESTSHPLSVTIPIRPTMEDGRYLVRASSLDSHDNEIVTEKVVHVSTNPLQKIEDALLLAADQPKYFVGGRAHLLINEPHATEEDPVTVLLTYERDGLLGHKILTLTQPVTRTTVPIEKAMMPRFLVTVTRFDRGANPSFTTASRVLEAGNDDSRILIDITSEPKQPAPGDEVTLHIKTYDYQNRPQSAVLALNLLAGMPPSLDMDYDRFFGPMIRGARSASNIGFRFMSSETPLPDISGNFESWWPNETESFYFDPLLTTNTAGEATLNLSLPDQANDLYVQAIATRAADYFGSADFRIPMNQALEIRPVLPRVVVPGDQTSLAAVVRNVSDQAIQSRLSFSSPDLAPKGDSARNFSLEPGQQTELAFSVFIDTDLDTDTVRIDFSAGNDSASGTIPLRHYRVGRQLSSVGVIKDLWTGHVNLPEAAYTGLGMLRLTLGGSPRVFIHEYREALESLSSGSTYALLGRFLLEDDPDALEPLTTAILKQAGKNGGFRFRENSPVSPHLSAYGLLAYLKATDEGVHIDSLRINQTIQMLLGAVMEEQMPAQEKAFALWVLSKAGQFDTELTLELFQAREGLSVGSQAFLLLNMDLLVDAGQSSLASAFDTLKSELLDRVAEEGDLAYVDGTAKSNAILLYALSELDPSDPVLDGLARYLFSAKRNLVRLFDPEEAVWTSLAFGNMMKHADPTNLNYIVQSKLNGELIVDQTVTGNSAHEVFSKVIDAKRLDTEGVNDLFIQKNGEGPLYFDAHLVSFMNPSQLKSLEESLLIVRRLCQLSEDGQCDNTDRFKKGHDYLSELTLVVPKATDHLLVTDFIPAGMRLVSADSQSDGLFSPQAEEPDRLSYYAAHLPAGVYNLRSKLKAVLPGIYLQLPATAQPIFAPGIRGRTNGETVQISD